MAPSYLVGKRNGATSPWTQERTALLIRLWGEGLTAVAIARQLGEVKITKSAVISKAWRLDLPQREAGRKRVPRRQELRP